MIFYSINESTKSQWLIVGTQKGANMVQVGYIILSGYFLGV